VVGYAIYRNGAEVGTSATMSYLDTGLTPSTTYSYTVSAYDAAGNNSAQSSPAATATTLPDTQPPSVPANVQAVSLTPRAIKVTWSASTDNIGVDGYKVYRNGGQVGESGTTSYTDVGLSPNTTYSYTLSAYDESENNSAQSSPAGTAQTMAAISIAAAKELPDASLIGMVSKIVTAVFADGLYIKETDRNAGIKVVPFEMPDGLSIGGTVDLGGAIQTAPGGERHIAGAVVSVH
jgi:chitodextrinase